LRKEIKDTGFITKGHHQRKEDDLSRMFDGQPARDQLGSSPFVGCIGEGKDVGEYLSCESSLHRK
jgi:hypothetical protein